ncbi:MAG: lipid-binding SYLF domain-containing protein [Gammaproteobacteria bacterium]|nr:MAG: lipid-binding SYLF domain-containing protein [Gammaproteobacteria bacterium]
MKKLSVVLLALSMIFAGAFAQAWEPDYSNKLELSVAQALIKAKDKNSSIETWLNDAYAYAVFPKVGKGGIGVGGAYGKGLVIRGDNTVGKTSMSQVTLGFQLGGQVYAEYILFKDKTAFDHFTRGNFEMGAQVSAVAITAGISADANYDGGVKVFTLAEGGLMYEATIGGQKFKFHDKQYRDQ